MLEEEKIIKGFKAAGDRMTGIEGDMKVMKRFIEDLTRSAKLFRSRGFGAEDRQNLSTFWPNEEMAKGFGELFLKALGRKALGEDTSTGGGILVPDDLRDWMIQKLGIYGKYRKNATVATLGTGGETMIPKIETDLTVYCVSENEEITESDMSFGQVKLNPKTWACLTKISSQLSEDSVIAMGEIVGISMARSMAKKEDLIGFMADGTETYFGMRGIVGALRAVDSTIANIAGLIVGSGNAYSELELSDFRQVCAILPEDAEDGAKWYVSKKFFWNVMLPILWAETSGKPTIGTPDFYQDKQKKYFLGYEVEYVHAMPSTEANSQICAILGDLQIGAYLGERKTLELEQSEHAFFTQHQIGIKGVERIDVNAFGVGDTTDPGAIVGLITAAS